MASISLIFTVLATYFCFANGQSACSPTRGGSGVCKSIFECPSLMKILAKSGKTEEDLNILKNSQCGESDNMACCPNPSCYTPKGQPGECVAIKTCPKLAALLKPPVSEENMRYIQNSTCTSMDNHSVCCEDEEVIVAAPGVCAASVSAFPPDPKTECCGVDVKSGDRIVGGNATSVGQYPWLILIEYVKQGRQGRQSKLQTVCGGSLISGRYVMTAAHCVVGNILTQVGDPVSIRLGEYDTDHSGKDCVTVPGGGTDCTEGIIQIPIEKIIVHPDYGTHRSHSPSDIALIRLSEPAPFTDFIRPICLPRVDLTANPPDNFILFAAGWGKTANRSFSNVKMHVDLPYIERHECQRSFSEITPRQICAGGVPGKDSCNGDSGGPLMYEDIKTYEAIGVVSYGPTPCGRPNIPGVYTKVYEYLPWIKETIVA